MTAPQNGQQWWQQAAIYQIYPLSWADSDADGYGDLAGITGRLDHLAGRADSLGVDALWLSPIFRSPMVDFGYDVADHRAVDPRFGTLADFDELLAQAHRRGLRVLLDFVPNHTSDQHDWFRSALGGRDAPYRDFYVWADPVEGGPPNNWLAAFEAAGPAWTFDEASGQYYLHSYTPQQPDLNWANPAVREQMYDVLRFWLDRGVDGFRVDAPHRLAKDRLLRDNPPDVVGLRLATQTDERRHRNIDHPDVHGYLRELRSVVDGYPDTVLLAEIGVHHPERRLAYYGTDGDEAQLIFDFGFWSCPWQASAFRQAGERLGTGDDPHRWPVHALSNHDISRHASRFAVADDPAASARRARAAAVLLLTLPGTAVLYYGEEIGMTDVAVPAAEAHDPDGRDPCRTPMRWDGGPAAGFSGGRPWLPAGDSGPTVEAQRDEPASLLALYRQLLATRRADPRLHAGRYRALDAHPDCYAYLREDDRTAGALLAVLNFGAAPVRPALPVAGSARVLVASGDRPAGSLVAVRELELGADEALLLELQ